MTDASDYVLGTHDAELARLGLQHRVWRSVMLATWARVGMTLGSRVVDFGAGPGYATFDAAEIVGRGGEVAAVERSERFLRFARAEVERRGLSCVRLHQADIVEDTIPLAGFDIAWCRWVAMFVSSPQTLVARLAASLRLGGKAVFHEYADYATWRMIPRSPLFEEFVAEVMASWRASGGEPDVALTLPPLMGEVGLKVIECRPIIFAIHPSHFAWQWPASFLDVNLDRLVELDRVSANWADAVRQEFRVLERNPDAIMMTPLVMEIIATRTEEPR